MVFRDIVSSYLTFLARVQTRLRITRMEVRMVWEYQEIVRLKKKDEEEKGDYSLRARYIFLVTIVTIVTKVNGKKSRRLLMH